jgi:hypothetical protein
MTQEEREDMRRHFGVLAEDVLSQLRMVAEGNAMTAEAVQRLDNKVDAFRADFDGARLETAREFAGVRAQIAAVRSEAEAFRDETAHNFAEVRSEAEAFRDETAHNFAEVRSEAEAFRDETARNFAAVRSEMASSRTGVPLPRRPRTRRRPN